MNKKILIVIMSFMFCISILFLSKWVLKLKVYGLEGEVIEAIFIYVNAITISIILIVFDKFFKFKKTSRLLLIEFLLCGISIYVFLSVAGTYKIRPDIDEENSPLGKLKLIESLDEKEKSIDVDSFLLDMTIIYLNYTESKDLENQIWKFVDKYLRYPNRFKNEPLKLLMKTLYELNDSDYELIKIGPKLFKLQTKKSILQKKN